METPDLLNAPGTFLSIDLTAFSSTLAPKVAPFLARLASLGVAPNPSSLPDLEPPPPSATTVTPALLRETLLQIGVTADPGNVLLAEAFSQLGIALTPAAFTEAHVSLGQAPGAAPLAYAFAKSVSLPTTPDILRALSTVTNGIPAGRALPIEVAEWLTLAVSAADAPESIAAHLSLMLSQRATSTEHRLTAAAQGKAPSDHDTRTLLLRLSHSAADRRVRAGADTLAAHIEGQQLINLASQREGTPDQPIPLYFAFPLLLPGEQTMLEMNVWPPKATPEKAWEEEEEAHWRTTVRLATWRLGRIEAELIGTPLGGLTCRLGAEKPATVRLLTRSREKLAATLAGVGWPQSSVSCHPKADWPPLWHGGQALTAPRTRVDREV